MVVKTEIMNDKSANDNPIMNCSDEEYLIARSKQALAEGKVWEAKTWMLTARAIFPNNFSIQFEAYLSEKSRGNVKESAKCLQVLFEKFSREDELVGEIRNIMDMLRKKTPDIELMEGEECFVYDLFENMSTEAQKKLILFSAERVKAHDPLEHCKLMLVFIKRFPDEISNYGEVLIETINNAESRSLGSHPDPLNVFRTILVTEILPTVLNQEKILINSKLLSSNLFKTQEYVLAVSLNRSHYKPEQINRNWVLLYNIVHNVAKILGWPPVPHVSLDSSTIPTDQYLGILSTSNTYMFQVLSCIVLHTVSEYTAISHDHILLEAWVTHDGSQDREKSKRRKTQDDPTMSLPVLSHMTQGGADQSQLVTTFQQAMASWALVTAHTTLETQFQSLVSQLTASLGRLTMFDNFLIDYKHYNNSVREVIGQVQSETNSSRPAWQALKTGTLQYCSGDHRSAAQSLVSCISILPQSPKDESDSSISTSGLTIPTARPRHCRFIPLTRSAVLTYCCRMLTSLLQEKALFPGAGGDLAMGHCMVLLQHNWEDCHDNRELFYHLLNRVRGKDGFTYPLFCKYIINIDILQEVMFLASEQGGNLTMEILPGSSYTGAGGARPGTRGANRGEREEFKSAMRRQAARSHESVEDIVMEFLNNESSLILQTLA